MLKLRIIATSGVCLAIVYICALIRGGSCVVKQLPDCNVRSTPSLEENTSIPSNNEKNYKELLLVSTLDGHVSALDPNDGGKMVWSHSTGPDSMYSSSITNVKMTSNGQPVRLVPSLDGTLFKFDGKSVDPLGFSADTLLKSSYKLGDDIIITGGKDSQSYGINLGTGKLRYSCSMRGCDTMGDAVNEYEDVLVVRRMTQIVRAVSPLSGEERWNFSVSEHEVNFLAKLEADCTGGSDGNEPTPLDEDSPNEDEKYMGDKRVKVAVPDGIVALVSSERNFIFWTHKFETPIVHAWHLKDNKLDAINLLDQKRVLGLSNVPDKERSPALYVGIHHQQLYIQQSKELKNSIEGAITQFALSAKTEMPSIEWKPYVATGQSRTPYINHGKKRPSMIEHTKSKVEHPSSALVLKQDDFVDYPYDSGYYLYGSTNLRSSIENNTTCPKNEETKETEETFYIMSPIFSFWHWWKEVCSISLVTSILFHVLYTRRAVKKIKKKLIEEKSSSGNRATTPVDFINVSSRMVDCPDSLNLVKISELSTENIAKENSPISPCEFTSRYTMDFEPIQRLGKGGFGVVFEARNKIDDCHYAVKRILLPDSLKAQEKVMREVKALAKLDHSGIVRYFNAWQETPPPGWQEHQDQQWEEGSQIMSTFNSPTPSITSSAPPKSLSPVLVKRNLQNLKDSNPFRRVENFSTSGSNNTINLTKNSLDQSGSRSFSFQREESNSFEVVFQNNLDKKSALLRDSINNGGSDTTNESSSFEFDSNIPFSELAEKSSLKRLNNLTIESLVKNDDSGCADHSSSTEEEYLSIDDRLLEAKHIFSRDSKSFRPNELPLTLNQQAGLQAPLKLYLYIQMQLCRKETLKDWLVTNINRERDEVLDIFDQIVSAVQYVHDCNLMHRDLKPSNIFFSVDGVIKVGDFGLVTALTENEVHTPSEKSSESNHVSSRHTNQVGTQLYMSPEQIAGESYSHKVDIFSLGLILFELLTPFHTQMERGEVMFNVKKHIFPKDFVKSFPDECTLVKKMLSHNPLERPSAVEIKKHPLFKAFQPEPEIYARHRRRRTLSQRFSSSGSDCDSQESSLGQFLKPPA